MIKYKNICNMCKKTFESLLPPQYSHNCPSCSLKNISTSDGLIPRVKLTPDGHYVEGDPINLQERLASITIDTVPDTSVLQQKTKIQTDDDILDRVRHIEKFMSTLPPQQAARPDTPATGSSNNSTNNNNSNNDNTGGA